MHRLALLSLHGCPVARLGEKDTGGMNVYVLETARALGSLGNLVDVYTRWHDPKDPQVIELGDNARVIHLKAGPCDRTKEGLYQDIPDFLAELYGFNESEGTSYDLVHSHYWLSGSAGIALSDGWNIPHVTTFHTLARKKAQARAGETDPEIRVAAESRVMESVDAIVVSTEQEREDLSRLYHVRPDNVEVIPPGVDTTLFRPTEKARAREKLGLTDERIVLSVGRIEPLKGLDILIGAMAKLEDSDGTRLLIVGGNPGIDPEIDRLRFLAERLGLQNKVTFAGTVAHTDLPTYYGAADVFVFPSYYESFGLVALEAMACGIPVIASRVGGPKAFIKEGKTGYLIPWRCPEPFAQRLDMVLANPALGESMGREARARVLSMDWDSVASRMAGLYGSLIEAPWTSAVGA